MTDVEKKIDRLEAKLDTYIRAQDNRFDSFVQEMRQQNQMRANEIRDLYKRQDEERRAREAEIREMNKKIDDVNKKIDNKFDKFSSQLHTMTIAAIVGFGAIAAAIGGLVIAVFK